MRKVLARASVHIILARIVVLCTADLCGANTMCKDLPNSFVCTCNSGYTGNAISGCTDKLQILEIVLSQRRKIYDHKSEVL